MEVKCCPFCGAKAEAYSFIGKIHELPQPIKLFGRWSLIKMRYRDIPVNYTVQCSELCEEFMESQIFVVESTKEKAIEEWNKVVDNG